MISGRSESISKRFNELISQKCLDIQNKMKLLQEKLDNPKNVRPLLNPRMISDISKNMDHIHQLLPGAVNAAVIQQPSTNPASPLSSIHRSLETLLDRESRPNSTRKIFTDTNLTSHPKTQGLSDEV
jgi:hypothetical protein